MFFVSAVRSAGGAANYFAKDNYYTQEQSSEWSSWGGKGATALSLSGVRQAGGDQENRFLISGPEPYQIHRLSSLHPQTGVGLQVVERRIFEAELPGQFSQPGNLVQAKSLDKVEVLRRAPHGPPGLRNRHIG